MSEQVYSGRDWPEDFEHENGQYFCRCCICKEQFIGYKRRIICKLCYVKPDEPAPKPDFDTLAQRLQEAERLLNDVSCRGTLMAWEPGLVETIDAFLAGKGGKP